MVYKIYLSGICYSKLYFENEKIFHSAYDFRDKKFLTKVEVEEDLKEYYFRVFRLDVDEFFELVKLKESEINLKGDFSYEDGVWYMRNRKFPLDIRFEDDRLVSCVICSRERVSVMCIEGFEDKTPIKKWIDYEGKREYLALAKEYDTPVEMRDGINLATHIMLPDKEEKTPTILVRTPYGKESLYEYYEPYVQRGYSVVIQDVRGRNFSEGKFEFLVNEMDDGDDTLTFIKNSEWSNGLVGTVGGSYLGFVQWAAAASGNNSLKAIASFVTAGSTFVDVKRKGGTFSSASFPLAFGLSEKVFMPEKIARDDWDELIKIRPIDEIAVKGLGEKIEYMQPFIDNYENNEFFDRTDFTLHKGNIKAPALIVSGWYDDNGMGTTQAIDVTSNYGTGKRKIILGPWFHSGNSKRDLPSVSLGNNALMDDIDLIVQKWFDHNLKGEKNDVLEMPELIYYTVGDNKWKTSSSWPPANTYEKTFFLGDGTLEDNKTKNGSISYQYDPEDEAPYLIDLSENELAMPANYKEVDRRNDVITFDTEEFEGDIVITGDMYVEFYASSDAPDTDWVIKTEEVDKKGNAIKLTDAFLSARFRNTFYKSEFMEKGKVYKFKLRTGKISSTIKKGNKFRLTITSSAKGLIFPNSNTKEGFNSKVNRVANNTIYFGEEYPSSIRVFIEK